MVIIQQIFWRCQITFVHITGSGYDVTGSSDDVTGSGGGGGGGVSTGSDHDVTGSGAYLTTWLREGN